MFVKVLVQHGIFPVQIDDFAKNIQRSTVGSIHFRPNTVKEITFDELQHIKKNHPWLAAKLLEIKEPKKESPKKKLKLEDLNKSSKKSHKAVYKKSKNEKE